MNGKIKVAFLSVVVLGLAACEDPPEPAIQSARAALSSADAAGAADYAPQSLAAAEAALQSLESELTTQEEKFSMFRDYEESTRLATEAQAAAEKAAADAEAGKQRVRSETEALLAQARSLIDEASTMLATAPRGKGSEVDLAVLQADIAGAGAVLPEVEQSLAAGRYLEAKSRAESALQTAQGVKQAVETAVTLSSSGGR
jgi:hypothetical protein